MKVIRESNSHRGLKFEELVQGEVYEHTISGKLIIKTKHSATDLANGDVLYACDHKNARFIKVEAELIIK